MEIIWTRLISYLKQFLTYDCKLLKIEKEVETTLNFKRHLLEIHQKNRENI